MATLISKDTSGVLQAQAGETEDLRTRGAKRFLVQTLPDGRKQYRVGASIGPLHYKRDPFDEAEPWQEIDLDLVPVTGKGWQWECDTNGYGVRVWQRYTMAWRYACEFRRAGEWVRMAPVRVQYANDAGETQTIGEPRKNLVPTVDNEANRIEWRDCFGKGLHFRYNLRPDEFFKTLTIDNADALPAATIGSEGLRVEIIMGLAWSGQAGNGFGKGRDLTVMGGAEDADEERSHRFGKHPHRRQDGREALWMAEPRAWDAEGETLPMQWGLERRGRRVFGAFGVEVAALEGAAWPVFVDTAITEENLASYTDDARCISSTWMNATTGAAINAAVVQIGNAFGSHVWSGYRFTPPIPQGATVDTAALSVLSYSNNGSYGSVVIYLDCEDVDNAATYAANATDTPTRTYSARTGETVSSTRTGWSDSTWYTLDDISGAVGHVVARDGWEESNGLCVGLWAANNTAATNYIQIYQAGNRAGIANAPKFNCTYTEASGNPIWYYNMLRRAN